MTKAQKAQKEVSVPNKAGNTDKVEAAKAAIAKMPTDTSISGTIRSLAAQGFERGVIAKATGKRYQHVRNVLITPLKRSESVSA